MRPKASGQHEHDMQEPAQPSQSCGSLAASAAAVAAPYRGRSPVTHRLAGMLRRCPLLYVPLRAAYRLFSRGRQAPCLPLKELEFLPDVVAHGPPARTAVVVHAYYLDLLPELRHCLSFFSDPPDVFITTPHRAAAEEIRAAVVGRCSAATIVLAENRGRDIGPFVALLQSGRLSPYSEVLKIHLKRSSYSGAGDAWRAGLLAELCGSEVAVSSSLRILRSGTVGLVGPHQYFLTNPKFWGSNRARTAAVLRGAGALGAQEEAALAFFAGSMFWFRPAALRLIAEAPRALFAFEEEQGQQDGTLAHALERSFCHIAAHSGLSSSSLRLDGADISAINADRHGIPVL